MKSILSIILAVCMAVAMAMVGTGCKHLDEDQRAYLKEAGKMAAKLAINAGLAELGDRVSELRPYLPYLQSAVTVTFAETQTAEEAGTELRSIVEQTVPENLRAVVLHNMAVSAIESQPPASSTQESTDFGNAFAKALLTFE